MFYLAIWRRGLVQYVSCVDLTWGIYHPYGFAHNLGICTSLLDLLDWILRWGYGVKIPFIKNSLIIFRSLAFSVDFFVCTFYFCGFTMIFSSLVAVAAHSVHITVLRFSCSPTCYIVTRIWEYSVSNPRSITPFFCGVPGDVNSKLISLICFAPFSSRVLFLHALSQKIILMFFLIVLILFRKCVNFSVNIILPLWRNTFFLCLSPVW